MVKPLVQLRSRRHAFGRVPQCPAPAHGVGVGWALMAGQHLLSRQHTHADVLRLVITSRGWRDTPPIVTMSRAPRPARPSPRPTRTRWRILLRQSEQHRRQKRSSRKHPSGSIWQIRKGGRLTSTSRPLRSALRPFSVVQQPGLMPPERTFAVDFSRWIFT